MKATIAATLSLLLLAAPAVAAEEPTMSGRDFLFIVVVFTVGGAVIGAAVNILRVVVVPAWRARQHRGVVFGPLLREVYRERQEDGRLGRWFCSNELALVVDLDGSGAVVGFHIVYPIVGEAAPLAPDLPPRWAHTLLWSAEHGLQHLPDFPTARVVDSVARARVVDVAIRDFVLRRLEEPGEHGLRHLPEDAIRRAAAVTLALRTLMSGQRPRGTEGEHNDFDGRER